MPWRSSLNPSSDSIANPTVQLRTQIGVVAVLIYLVSIFFLPRLEGRWRVEDLFTPFMAIILLVNLTPNLLKLGFAGILYGTYTFIVTVAAIIGASAPIGGLLIWGKEIQYILGYMLVLAVLTPGRFDLRRIRVPMTFLCAAGAAYAIYSVIFGKVGYYGISYLNETSPSLSMWIYCYLLVFSFFLRSHLGGAVLTTTILSIALFGAIMVVGSRTGVIISLAFVFFLASWKYRHKAGLVLGVTLAACACLSFIFAFDDQIYQFLLPISSPAARGISRLATLKDFLVTIQASRFPSWISVINEWLSGNMFFGCGRGCLHIDAKGNFTPGLGADNQFTSDLAEIGIFGLLARFLVVGWHVNLVKPKYYPIYIPFVLMALVGGMTAEVWQLSKPGQLYWILTAIFVALSQNSEVSETMVSPDGKKSLDLGQSVNSKLHLNKVSQSPV